MWWKCKCRMKSFSHYSTKRLNLHYYEKKSLHSEKGVENHRYPKCRKSLHRTPMISNLHSLNWLNVQSTFKVDNIRNKITMNGRVNGKYERKPLTSSWLISMLIKFSCLTHNKFTLTSSFYSRHLVTMTKKCEFSLPWHCNIHTHPIIDFHKVDGDDDELSSSSKREKIAYHQRQRHNSNNVKVETVRRRDRHLYPSSSWEWAAA